MQFHHTLYAMPLLTNIQNGSPPSPDSKSETLSSLLLKIKLQLFDITKKTGYLLFAAFFSNSVPAIEAGDIKNIPSLLLPPGSYRVTQNERIYASYRSLATAPNSRTFDYDPSLLPDVAEVIFALRVKHANIGEPFVINLSGNYLLRFTEDRIDILDMYTKNSDVYEFQSTNPNITIGLGVSKGLPRNYKSIVIKEDAHGKLYDYAALHSDNISTDETMLSETLSHPFYQIAGKEGVEKKVKIPKAMAFYQKVPSHSRHARCVKESMGIMEQIQDILGGSLVCGPKADSGILSANHQPADTMKLQEKLVEATSVDKGTYRETVGYHLRESVDLNGRNAIATLTSALWCKVPFGEILEHRRRKRSPTSDSGNCLEWVSHLIELFIHVGLNLNNARQIVQSIRTRTGILASHFLNGVYPAQFVSELVTITSIIEAHSDAEALLVQAAAQTGQALMDDQSFLDDNNPAASSSQEQPQEQPQADLQTIVAEGRLGIFTLLKEDFNPVPNVVKKINPDQTERVVKGEQYKTYITRVGHQEKGIVQGAVSFYMSVLSKWMEKIMIMVSSDDHIGTHALLLGSYNIALGIYEKLSEWQNNPNLVISDVFLNGNLIGISIGTIENRTFRPMYEIASPGHLLRTFGSIRGQLAYLRSEVLKYLFDHDLIDSAKLTRITKYSAGKPATRYPKHDEL